MRRTTGLIALFLLLLGAIWLVWNGYDQAGRESAVFEPARSGDEFVPPPDEVIAAPDFQGNSSPTAPTETETAVSEPEESPAGNGTASDSERVATAEPRSATRQTEPADESAAASPSSLESADPAPPPVADETPSGETSAAGTVPSFDIVRVEPSGETVIAGVASPEATVEVLDGADPLATAKANERGEWALVLDEPLPPGSHDLAIRTTSPNKSVVTLSDQRIAVSVPENKTEEPLVVLNAPDAPSRVMQVPSEQNVASADQPAEAKPDTASPEPDPARSQPPVPSATPGEGEIAAAPPSSEVPGPSTQPSRPDAGSEPAVPGPDAAAPPAQAPDTQAGSDLAARPASPPGTPAEPETLAAENPPPAPEAPEASESEPSTPQPNPQSADSATRGEPSPSTGDTLSESDMAAALPEPPPTPPASSEPPSSGAAPPVASVAPQPDTPQTSEPRAPSAGGMTTEEPTSEEPSESPAMATEPKSEPEVPAATQDEPPPPAAEVAVAAVEAETDGTLYIAGTSATSEPVRVYVDGELVGEATPSETGTWLIETERELPEGTYSVRADQVGEGGAVVARAEVPFEREIDVAVLKQTTDAAGAAGQADAEVSGTVAGPATVIIKRGDNLWRISRAMYGRGIRYSTIYQANRDQIRDPDLIYPGQVFVLPSGDTSWQN